MENKDRRKYATRALREIGQDASDAIPALIKAASDSDAGTREYAIEALGRMILQTEQVMPYLEKALNDKNSDVKEKADRAIKFLKAYPEEVKKQKELAEQEELKRQEDARKQKELAEQAEQKKQDEIRKQKELAEQGNVAAQYSLGLIYYDGKGVLRDYNEAAKWFTKAAKQGHADSQFFLGQMYYEGKGVSENYNEAVKWFTKAAEQGHKDSQASLLEMKNIKETLKVKGFYIGMSIDKAVKLLNEKYKNLLLLNPEGKIDQGPTSFFVRENSVSLEYMDAGGIFASMVTGAPETVKALLIKADESGKVILIRFNSDVVNKLFNAADMDSESFAQAFINNYDIPRLSPKIETEQSLLFGPSVNSYWTYTSDKGFRVIITENKELIIEKVARAEERKFD